MATILARQVRTTWGYTKQIQLTHLAHFLCQDGDYPSQAGAHLPRELLLLLTASGDHQLVIPGVHIVPDHEQEPLVKID